MVVAPMTFRHVFLASLLGAATAGAQASQPPEPTPVTAEVALPSGTAAPEAFADVGLSPVLTAGLGLGLIGDDLVGELGAQTLCLQALDEASWLLQWDALAAFRTGVLANTYPYALFVGGAGRGFVELGHRFSPASAWSPYLGGRLAASLAVMGSPGHSLGALDTLNNNDGFGGVNVDGALRVAGGFSYLRGGTSFLVSAFAQEALVAPGLVTAGLALTEFGVSLRLDLQRSFTLSVEALAGFTPVIANPALQLTDQKIRLGVSGTLRKAFGEVFWMGLSGSYTRDSDHLVYPQAGASYDTVHPGTTTVTLTLGLTLWRPR
jgi:hypothetical protein